MTEWAALFAAAGKPMVLENCHNSDMQDPCPESMACPETAVCPYNLWRYIRHIRPILTFFWPHATCGTASASYYIVLS